MKDDVKMGPIEILSVSDALEALKRSKGSFEEWLDCARIFATNCMWSELEVAAFRALESAKNRPLKPILLSEAAMRFAAGSLKSFSSEIEFKENCNDTIKTLKEIAKLFPQKSNPLKSYIDSVIATLDEIVILLADGSTYALTSIASKLRKRLARPDLAIKVATVAISIDSHQYAAYTTRASAFAELENYSKALEDFIIAESDKKNRPYAIAGHTKLLIMQSDFHLALELGSELLKSNFSRPLLYLLAAAAKGSRDEDKFNWLVEQAELLPEVQEGAGKVLLMRQSIKILIENKQFDIADALVNQLESVDKPGRIKTFRIQIQKKRAANA